MADKEIMAFTDLDFMPHPSSLNSEFIKGVMARMTFPNKYGVSVIRYQSCYTNDNNEVVWKYESYTSNESEWEVALTYEDKRLNESPLPEPYNNEVLSYLSNEQVTEIMKLLQEIK